MTTGPRQPRTHYPPGVKSAINASNAVGYATCGSLPYERCAKAFIRSNPHMIVPDLIERGLGRSPVVEAEIQSDAKWSVEYAEGVIGGRFRLAERRIATDAVNSVEYAIRVLRGPFVRGEKAIAKHPLASVRYARYLRRRFPAGESAIFRDDKRLREYLLEVIRVRDNGFEAVVCMNGAAAVTYAEILVRGRWPQAEAAIAAEPAFLYRYARDAVRGRLPLHLDNMMTVFGITGVDPYSVNAYTTMLVARGW
jgi:hypothetical protein